LLISSYYRHMLGSRAQGRDTHERNSVQTLSGALFPDEGFSACSGWPIQGAYRLGRA
jgi:hypothetical protein